MSEIGDKLAEQTRTRLDRVRGLVDLYERLAGPISGRPTVYESDVLRAAVVFLHATLEDFLRSLAAIRLPDSSSDILQKIPPAGGDGRKTIMSLGDLHGFRGRSIDDFIRESVESHLNRSNYSNIGDIKRLLGDLRLEPKCVDPHAARLAALMTRRHHIAHRFDQNESTGRGHHAANSISKVMVSAWIETVDQLMLDILQGI
jgi:hypothetical protein